MRLAPITHRNWIEEEINESLEHHPDVPEGYVGRMIFCKKRHEILEPMPEDYDNCSYFAGFMQGHGHECVWDDDLSLQENCDGERDILWEDREREMMRVSHMIADGMIKKG